jgi:hypothetical protein
MENSQFIQIFSAFELLYKEKIKDNHTKWAKDFQNSTRYKEDIAKMIIFLGNEPSQINKHMFDMRFIFKKKSGGYSFINPIVKEFFLEEYLTDGIIEWFVKEYHKDYTGSFFGSLFEMYIKRKLIKESTMTLKLNANLEFNYEKIFKDVLQYVGQGGPKITFEFTSLDHDLRTAGGYFIFPSQENFPVYNLVYKAFDSHIYCIAIRSYRLKEGKQSFDGSKHVLSPEKVNLTHPIDKLFNHYNEFKNSLGKFFIY